MRTPEEIAAEIVDGLSFSSNRMVNGRMISEQYFAAQAIADAIRKDREEREAEPIAYRWRWPHLGYWHLRAFGMPPEGSVSEPLYGRAQVHS